MSVHFDGCSVVHETDKALLVHIPEIDTKPVWIQKSQIHDDSEVYKTGTEGELVVTDWVAEQKGWV